MSKSTDTIAKVSRLVLQKLSDLQTVGIDQFEELRATKPRQIRRPYKRRNQAVEKFF